jgi:hypothetical protein
LCGAIAEPIELERIARTAWGREPNETERAILRDALPECSEPECTRAMCRAVLGAAEGLYY